MAQEQSLMVAKPQLPGYWHFVWMFFMQPITLHKQLKACGIEKPDISTWDWWIRRRQLDSNYGLYMHRVIFMLVAPIGWAVYFGLRNYFWLDDSVLIRRDYIGLNFPYIIGIGVMFGFMSCRSLGVIFIVVGSILCPIVYGQPDDLILIFFGGAIGVYIGLPIPIMMGIDSGVADELKESIIGGLVGSIFIGVMVGGMLNPKIGMIASLVFIVTFFRLALYPFELLLQLTISLFGEKAPTQLLRFTPLLFHDLCFLPYPGLARRIVSAAAIDATLAQHVICVANRSVGQKRAAATALAELQAAELCALTSTTRFAAIAELQGQWLPGEDNASPLLTAFAACARFMQAGLGTLSPHISLQHFNAVAQQLQAINNQLLTSQEPIARFLPPVLQTWHGVLEAARSEAAAKAQTMLPNPFVTGLPLSPSMAWGQAVFRGREILIQQVETLLADQQNATSIALIGPRRCGKSSLLNMLRVMLPDTIVVLFDLQSNPVDTPTAFYQALAHTAREQAQRSHRLQLPELVFTAPNGQKKSPIEALKHWLDQLEHFATQNQRQHRILICIDEFERLETLFPDQNRELLQLMGLFRATIQHGRRVRLLVAGAAPFDELGTLWNDHFINLREMRLGFLDEETVVQLLTKPIDEFPPDAISAELAHDIYRRSRGQPFLTQVYGYALVETLNRSKRKSATLDDIEQIEPELLSSYTYYFRGIWQEVPPEGQAALTALAHGEPITLARETKRWLRRRMLVDDEGQLLVPLFGRWIREKDEMV